MSGDCNTHRILPYILLCYRFLADNNSGNNPLTAGKDHSWPVHKRGEDMGREKENLGKPKRFSLGLWLSHILSCSYFSLDFCAQPG